MDLICVTVIAVSAVITMGFVLWRHVPKNDHKYIEDMMCHFTQSFDAGFRMGKTGEPGVIEQVSYPKAVEYLQEPDPEDEIRID